jgi:transcriptional regulator with XRE-family HTH domain
MSRPATRPPYPFADTVGSQIREARLARGLSVRKFAAEADLSRRHLVELERGSNVTLLVARNAMKALRLATLRLGSDDTDPLTLSADSAEDTGLSDAAKQLELGAALILQASTVVKAAAGEPTPERKTRSVRSELAAKAAALIRQFEAHVHSLDSEEQVDALTRLVQESVAPVHNLTTNVVFKKQRTSA